MKLKDAKILRKTKKIRQQLIDIIDSHEEWSKSFFWTPNRYSNRDFDNSYIFKLKDGSTVTVNQRLQSSRKNYYYSNTITLEDSDLKLKRKDIRLIKVLLEN